MKTTKNLFEIWARTNHLSESSIQLGWEMYRINKDTYENYSEIELKEVTLLSNYGPAIWVAEFLLWCRDLAVMPEEAY